MSEEQIKTVDVDGFIAMFKPKKNCMLCSGTGRYYRSNPQNKHLKEKVFCGCVMRQYHRYRAKGNRVKVQVTMDAKKDA